MRVRLIRAHRPGRGVRTGAVAALVLATSLAVVAAPPVPSGAAGPAGPVAPADCGPGSSPETGVQGQVPEVDRDSGRSAQGYWCNLELVGQFQGKGAGVVSPTYQHCSYTGTFTGSLVGGPRGVDVLDVSNPAKPRPVTTLTSPAMSTVTWETLKVHEGRGLLAAVGVPAFPGEGVATFDIYDISQDCTKPRLLNRVAGSNLTPPLPILGSHEGDFSPDGNTYWASGAYNGALTAIDVSDPTDPEVVWGGASGLNNHGLSVSEDGNTLYAVSLVPAGIHILDVSDVQARKQFPSVRSISELTWDDGQLTQHTIPFTSGSTQYLMVVDEGNNGGVRLINIDDPAKPFIAKRYTLEIGLPENLPLRQQDVGGNGAFGYNSHYCALNGKINPTAMACGYFHSGIRIFDIRNPLAPREIAYFNPPAQIGKTLADLPNSTHAFVVNSPPLLSSESLTPQNLADSVVEPDMTADWCMSPPQFRNGQIWVTCNDAGFMILKFTNGVKP